MRQRRLKDAEAKIGAYDDLLMSIMPARSDNSLDLSETPERHSRWYQRKAQRYGMPHGFENACVYVEIGCGRGRFINELALRNAANHALFIGVEGCKSVLIRAMKRTAGTGISNLRYIDCFINDACEAFAPTSVDGIYLNFSDPWPKDRHADRRLTAPKKAKAYYTVLKPTGFVELKTDDEKLFDYSIETFRAAGFKITEITRDMYDDESAKKIRARNIPTEYELKFVAREVPIFYLRAEKVCV